MGSLQQICIIESVIVSIKCLIKALIRSPLNHSYSALMRAINTLFNKGANMLFCMTILGDIAACVLERVAEKTYKYRTFPIKVMTVIATKINITACLQRQERAVKRSPHQLTEGKSISDRRISKFTKYS